jgi:O-antigen ligase
LAFVFSIPFESANLGFTSQSFALTKLLGFIFFACYLFYYNPFLSHIPHRRSFPPPPNVMWWFLLYVMVYALNGFFISQDFTRAHLGRLFTLTQLLILFWIATRLLEENQITKNALLSYAIGTTLLAIGMLLELPGFSQGIGAKVGGERLTALGANPNLLGALFSLAAVILIGLRLSPVFEHPAMKILLVIMTLPVLAAMVRTGSRGGILVFVIGCGTYLIPYWRSKRRMTTILLAISGIIFMIYLVLSNSTASSRLEMTIEEGHTSGRDVIYPVAIDMILEQPILGWQPYEFLWALGSRVGASSGVKDAHNLFLHLFLEVGALGALPFLLGLWLCGLAAWKAREGWLGLLPLAIYLTMLATNMTGTWIARKPFWLILALAWSSTFTITSSYEKPQERLDGKLPWSSGKHL